MNLTLNKHKAKLEVLKKTKLERFDKAVSEYFAPIASKLHLPLFRVSDGIYELPSRYHILRIRLDTGHSSQSLNVLLRKTSLRDFIDDKPGIQLGIKWFREFNGEEEFKSFERYPTHEEFSKQTRWFATETDRWVTPYLLGLKDDFEILMKFIDEKGEAGRQKVKEMTANVLRNMKGKIRAEWPVVILREKGEERETAKEFRANSIHFLGELEGREEQIFKEKLAEFFKRDRSVMSAYLARIIGLGVPATAALCLRTQFGFDRGMMEKVGRIFAQIFDINENFNVIFLTEKQESMLANVCRPFFAINYP
jgi:hypothetical protein